MTTDAYSDNFQESLNNVISTFKRLDPDEQEKMIEIVRIYFGLAARGTSSTNRPVGQEASSQQAFMDTGSFSEDRSISPKVFILQKQPRTDVERVACLAYYLTHYKDMPHFKTSDLSILNTEAAQPKFSNAAQAVDNATKTGYLVPATKGNKQLSAAGEHFVLALPDREAARTAMQIARPRRKTRKSNQKRANES